MPGDTVYGDSTIATPKALVLYCKIETPDTTLKPPSYRLRVTFTKNGRAELEATVQKERDRLLQRLRNVKKDPALNAESAGDWLDRNLKAPLPHSEIQAPSIEFRRRAEAGPVKMQYRGQAWTPRQLKMTKGSIAVLRLDSALQWNAARLLAELKFKLSAIDVHRLVTWDGSVPADWLDDSNELFNSGKEDRQ